MHYSSFPGRINVEKTSEQYFQLLPPIENYKNLFNRIDTGVWGEELVLVRFITVMAGSGPQQISPPHTESVNVHQQGELHSLEHGNHVDN